MASGLMQVVNAAFVRLVTAPAWLPPFTAVAAGLALAAIGAAIVADRWRRPAGLALATLLVIALLSRVPEVLANPGAGYVWTNPAKILALLGGALVLAGAPVRAPALATAFLALFLLIAGVQHVMYAGFVDTLVPAWIPPNPRFWTLFTAVALLAAGVGLLLPPTRRLAGLLAGVMIFGWVVLLHVPRSLGLRTAFELAGVFEALALGGVAWLVAFGKRFGAS